MDNLSPNPNKAIQPNYRRTDSSNHRFVPTEKPRVVTEHPSPAPTKIAGGVGFNPVATMALPDKTVFVRPVKNTHARPVSPGVLTSSGKLQVTAEKTIEISDNLHSQIKAKVSSTMKNLMPTKPVPTPGVTQKYVNSSDVHNLPKPAPKSASPSTTEENKVQTQARNENLKKQLDSLNKTLFEQIRQKISEEITRQIPTSKPNQPLKAQTAVAKPTVTVAPKQQQEQVPTKQPIHQETPVLKSTAPISHEHLRTLVETKPVVPTIEVPEVKTIQQPKALDQTHKEAALIQATTNQVVTKEPPKDSNSVEDYKNHIGKLEDEINMLNKEVNYMDRTIADLEKERDSQEIASIEKKIEVDRAMLKAVADWRFALNNLINSHTVALRYLKQKTDWLETQVEKISGHSSKHATAHHKPRPIEIKMSPLPPLKAPLPTEVKITGVETNKVPGKSSSEVVIGSKLGVTEVTQDQGAVVSGSPLNVAANLNVASVDTPANAKTENKQVNIQANLITKEVSPTQNPSLTGPTVVKEVQTTSFEAVKNLVQEALRKEQPNIKPSDEAVKTLVDRTLENKELIGKTAPEDVQKIVDQALKTQNDLIHKALEKEIPHIKPDESSVKALVEKTLEAKELTAKATPESVKAAVDQTLKEQANLVKPSVEEIKNIIHEELTEQKPTTLTNEKPLPTSKEDLKSLVKEIISEENIETKPSQVTVNLTKESATTSMNQNAVPQPSVAPAINVNVSQADIEKQILDAASKEEAEREAREGAKREVLRKQAEETAIKKLAEVKSGQGRSPQTAAPSNATPTNQILSEDSLRGAFAKLKTNLTTIDNQTLGNLSNDQRTEMIQKLQNLEKDTEVSRQFDELKAAAERRRINNELQAMLGLIGAKTAEAKPTTTQPTQQKIETLKIEEKKQQTPEEKAKVIAEIKDLERQSQARKTAEALRPVMKAQPAYGKMLPNTPTIPNVINGIVKDTKGLLLPTVIIIVKDTTGEPVRALKTNKIGQFALSTAVPNGTYTLELEKEGYDFDIIEVDVNGTIMQPIEIKSK